MGLLPLYLSPSGSLVEAGRIQRRQADRLIVSSEPVKPATEPPASGHHLVPVDNVDGIEAKPGQVLVIEATGPRVLPETEFLESYPLVKAVNLHDRANPG